MSGREIFRLGSLVAALCLVTVLVVMLRRPETAEKLDHVFAAAAVQDVPSNRAAAAVDQPERPLRRDLIDAGTFRKLLELAGWGANRFAPFSDGQPLNDDERSALLDLLLRLKSIDPADFQTGGTFGSIVASSGDHRGELVELKGRVTRVERRTLPPELAERFETPAYTECDLVLDNGAGTATLVAAHVPDVWFEMEPLDEAAEARGVFVKRLPANGQPPAALFVVRDVAWYPRQEREPHVTFSDVVLGELGMDVGLLDHVAQRRPIVPRERDAFYALLVAASCVEGEQLLRLANENLPKVREHWAAEASELRKGNDQQRLQLAEEVVARADQGRYSVAPLFNDPANQVGQLVSLDGLARRAIRIDVGADTDGHPSDVARRFGIDHYYELDVFTDDSQNNPVVFCVAELPPGIPTGESIREPVRVAGFFFKSWSFENRRGVLMDGDAVPTTTRQFAPLLIGRAPIRLETTNPKRSAYAGYWLAAGFLAMVAAIWAVGWYFARDERKFADQWIRDRYSLPPGESLDDLDGPTDDASGGRP